MAALLPRGGTMKYRDGEEVALDDVIEVYDPDDQYEPERAVVVKVGKRKIQVEFFAVNVAKEWVESKHCEMISRGN